MSFSKVPKPSRKSEVKDIVMIDGDGENVPPAGVLADIGNKTQRSLRNQEAIPPTGQFPGSAARKTRILPIAPEYLELEKYSQGRSFVNVRHEYEQLGRTIATKIPGLYFICGCMEGPIAGPLSCENCHYNSDRNSRFFVKVGLAIDFIDRFASYHTYFPRGFTILQMFALVKDDSVGSIEHPDPDPNQPLTLSFADKHYDFFDLTDTSTKLAVSTALRLAETDVLEKFKVIQGINTLSGTVQKNRVEWMQFTRPFDDSVVKSLLNMFAKNTAQHRYQVLDHNGMFVRICCTVPKPSYNPNRVLRSDVEAKRKLKMGLTIKS